MDYYVKIIKQDENNKNIKINGSYLIERAIEYNDIKSIKYLLSINCNIYIPKILFNPIKYNKIKIIKLLTNYNNLIYEQLDNKNHNSLHYAIRFNNKDIIKILIDKFNLLDVDIYNNTYLHYAIKYYNIYFIELLIKKIFNNKIDNNFIKIFEIKNTSGLTPLMFFIINNINYNILYNIICKLQYNININYNITDNNNNTLLNYILNYYDEKIIIYFFNKLKNSLSYINWNTQDNNGNSLIHNIIINNYNIILNFIFNNININYNIYNINFETPFILYLKIHKKDISSFNINDIENNILFKISDYYFTDIKGNCALYYLLKYNINKETLKYINNIIKEPKNIINNKNISLKSLDKYKIINFIDNIDEEKNIINTDIKYSSLPFDIICSCIKLKYLNYNLSFDFNNINYLKSLFKTSLQYFLIWKDKELINKELLNNINYYKGFSIFFILIYYENITHTNIIIFNSNNKTSYRFDPYGYYYNNQYDLKYLDNIFYDFCKKYKYNYSYYNKIVGVQQYESKNKLYINDLNGYCLVWCLLFAEDFINNKELSLDNFINRFNNLYNNNSFCNNQIKQKQNEISKIRDIILKSLHIDINDYCNDIIDNNIIKKIFYELNNIYKKYIKYQQ